MTSSLCHLPPRERRHSTQILVVTARSARRSLFGEFYLRHFDCWRDRGNHLCGDLILEVEDVFQCTVKPVGPEMSARRTVYELTGDTDPSSSLPNAAFKHVSHSKFSAHLLNVYRLPFVREAGIAGDDE